MIKSFFILYQDNGFVKFDLNQICTVVSFVTKQCHRKTTLAGARFCLLIFLSTIRLRFYFYCVYTGCLQKTLELTDAAELFFSWVISSWFKIQLCWHKARHTLCFFLLRNHYHRNLGVIPGNSLSAVSNMNTT